MQTWSTLLALILLPAINFTVNSHPSRHDRAFVGGPVRDCPSGMMHDKNGVCRPVSSNAVTTPPTHIIIIRPEANTSPIIITRSPPTTTMLTPKRTRRPTSRPRISRIVSLLSSNDSKNKNQ